MSPLIKSIIKKYIRRVFPKRIPKDIVGKYYINKIEKIRLSLLPRKQITKTKLNRIDFWLTDPYWFLQNHNEIFITEIYKFKTENRHPLIIDCGSNIGLSILYFKLIFPESDVIGFEPDPEIFEFLQKNMKNFNLANVNLLNKAVWMTKSTLFFQRDGSLGGRLVDSSQNTKTICIESIRLSDYLTGPVDMLKIDIEGAEYEVLLDCQGKLQTVRNIFVEYHGTRLEKQKLHEVLQIISDAGFRYHIKEANPILHPFIEDERNRMYDLQLNIFCFRE